MSADTTWDIPGMKTAVYVDGTINDPRDTDRGWSVEFAIPWSVLTEYAHKPCPPENGDMWRVNFSRVEVVHEIVTADYTPQDRTNNAYRRKEGIPEDNWVWSPQGVINMHCPEKWGYVRFSASTGDHEKFHPDPTAPARTVLLDIYYAQRDFHTEHNSWASSLTDLGLDYRGGSFLTRAPVLEMTPEGYRAAISYSTTDGKSGTLTISQDSRIGE
jgi:hypothetical protein